MIGRLLKRKPKPSARDDLVSVATAVSEPMAQSWAQMLRNNEIPAMVKSGGAGFSFGGPPPFGATSYVLVPKSRLDDATAVLEPFATAGEPESEELEEEEIPR